LRPTTAKAVELEQDQDRHHNRPRQLPGLLVRDLGQQLGFNKPASGNRRAYKREPDVFSINRTAWDRDEQTLRTATTRGNESKSDLSATSRVGQWILGRSGRVDAAGMIRSSTIFKVSPFKR